jgi:hypothetical protein
MLYTRIQKKKWQLALLCLLTILAQCPPVLACSFDSQPYYTYTSHPDLPLDAYAAGRLGILQPGYARSYLLVAYRYLSGANLSAKEQESIIKLWNERLAAYDTQDSADTSGWLKARAAVPGVVKIDRIDTERPINKDEPWQTYCNCQTSAFDTAAKTLKTLIDKNGAGSASVKDWLNAQDAVFDNCGYPRYSDTPKPGVIPSPLPITADPVLQKHRLYQIAAANFYAQNFEEARKDFDAIAGDTDSPWRQIAAYLAVRTMIRQASLSKTLDKELLAEARQRLRTLATNPSFADMASDIAALDSYVAARLTPEEHLRQLVTSELSGANLGEITKTIDNIVSTPPEDSGESTYGKLPEAVKKLDNIDWTMTFQANDFAAKDHALARWKQTNSVPWLVAAISLINKDDPEAENIIAAAERDKSDSARWTLFFHVNRLKIAAGQIDTVRTRLDKVLDNLPADLPQGSFNQLKTQRLAVSRNLDEFVRFATQTPLAICSNGNTEQVPDDIGEIVKSGKTAQQTPEFTPEAATVLDNKLPLSLLKQVATNKNLPRNLQNNVAWTSWVRAVLIGEDATALALARIASPLNKKKGELFDAYLASAYLASKSAVERRFAAAFLMLQFSSAQPNPTWGPLQDDSYGDASGWWWGPKPVVESISTGFDSSKTVAPFEPLFLTTEQKSQAQQEISKLAKIETAPNYFAKAVLSFAREHPTDNRVPEALHLLVKSTRYGLADEMTKAFSKQAYTLLHTKYKTSAWATKTPYYY